jgi:hypothetical protein
MGVSAGSSRLRWQPGTMPACRHREAVTANLNQAGHMSENAGMDTAASDTAAATPAGSLTRAQVAEILGISIAGVRRREGKNLHPKRGPKGECLFDPAEVEAERQRMLAESQPAPMPMPESAQAEKALAVVAKATPNEAAGTPAANPGEATPSPPADMATPPVKLENDGTIAAQVFALFSQGKTPVEVVIETKLAPAVIEALYESWLHMKAKDVTSPAACSRIDALAAEVKALQDEVHVLKLSHHVLDLAVNGHGHDLRGLANQLSGIVERVGAIEQYLADPTVREMAECARNTADSLRGRVMNFERTFQSWVPHMQALCQRLRM